MLGVFSLLSAILIHIFIRQSGRELINSWLETEAIQIQEGNFLDSLSRFSRTLLSSKIVTSVTLYSSDNSKLEVQASYGDHFDVQDVCKLPDSNEIMACTKGIFHEVFVYRPSIKSNIILVIETKPSIAFSMFGIILFSASFVSIFFMKSLKKIIEKESDEREFLVKTALGELMNNSQPSEILLRDFPTIAEKWQEMQILLFEMRKEIERSSKAALLANIAQNIAHDLRAPLGTFERLILAPDESLPKMRGAVKDSLNRLYSMIDSLRHSEVENLVHRSNSTVNFIYGEETLQAKASEHSIELIVPKSDMQEVWIDPMKVERAWINLASNAIEAAKSFVKVETEKQGTSLFIRVIDDGPGVPAEVLPKLFQRGMTHGKAGGTGLGLAYVKQIIQGHGGEITYRRENGLTIFECRLPQAFSKSEDEKLDIQAMRNVPIHKIESKNVAIKLIPESLALEVCESLRSYPSDTYTFTCELSDETEIIVLNDDELLLQAMDDGKEPLQLSKTLDQKQIIDRLIRKFNLV